MNTCREEKSSQGSALVIVLGLLSVLMIAAVAFSVAMKTERNSAANHRNATFARHAVRSGLASAIEAIEKNLEGKDQPDWEDGLIVSKSDGYEEPVVANVITYESLKYLPGVVQLALRKRYSWPHANGTPTNSPEWVAIGMSPSHGAESQRAKLQYVGGRYAFAVVNISDMLDINVAGGETRKMGSSPKELVIDNMVEVVNATEIDDRRTDDGEYETLAQAREALAEPENRDENDREPYGMAYWFNDTGGRGDLDSHFTTFSHFPTTNDTPVKLKSDIPGLISQRAEIESRLEDIKQDPRYLKDIGYFKPGFIVDALLDYLDEDSVIGNYGETPPDASDLTVPNTERVPMINEVALEGRVAIGEAGQAFRARIATHVTAEIIDPYIEDFDAIGEFDLFYDSYYWIRGTNGFDKFEKATNGNFPIDNFTSPPGIRYATTPFPIMGNETLDGVLPDEPIKLTIFLRVAIRAPNNGDWVDAVPAIPGKGANGSPTEEEVKKLYIPFAFEGTAKDQEFLQPAELPSDDYGYTSFEAIDPRFNWAVLIERNSIHEFPDPSSPLSMMWVPQKEPTLGQPNAISRQQIKKSADDPTRLTTDRDMDTPDDYDVPRMRISNIGELRSPGELGCVLMSDRTPNPFGLVAKERALQFLERTSLLKSVRLFDHSNEFPRHPVFENFVMDNGIDATKGKVHLNSKRPEILEAALTGFPLDFLEPGAGPNNSDPLRDPPRFFLSELDIDDPGDPNDDKVSAAELISAVTNVAWSVQGEEDYGNMDMIDWRSLTFGEPDEEISEVTRESIFASTRGLLGARQNLFLVLLRGDAFMSSFGRIGIRQGTVLATSQAVALIWRDPLADDNGTHPYHIRLFRESSD